MRSMLKGSGGGRGGRSMGIMVIKNYGFFGLAQQVRRWNNEVGFICIGVFNCIYDKLLKGLSVIALGEKSSKPSDIRHENFQEKAGIPAFLVKIHAFSFLFMIFWAFLTRFPAFLLKVILMSEI